MPWLTLGGPALGELEAGQSQVPPHLAWKEEEEEEKEKEEKEEKEKEEEEVEEEEEEEVEE